MSIKCLRLFHIHRRKFLLCVVSYQLSEMEQQKVFDYIKNIIDMKKQKNQTKNLSKYFGSLKLKQDALLMQKAMRDEWN